MFPTATSSQQDTPVSRSVSQVSAKDKRMTATSGRTSYKLLHKKDPLGAFSKMFMVTSHWASTKCFLTWKPKATPHGRLLYQLAPSMRPTEEIESGSSPEMWATPNTMDHLPQRSKESLKKQATTSRKGRARPANLREQVNPETVQAWKEAQEPTMWATPTASSGEPPQKTEGWTWTGLYWINDKGEKKQTRLKDQVAMWPTPTANEDAAGTPNGKMQRQLGNHPAIRGTTPEEWKRGSLNPTWVEWLMGYPEGWTDLKD